MAICGLPGQSDLPGTAGSNADLLKRKAAAPLRPARAQLACDAGLFGDEKNQLDLPVRFADLLI
jgi:hypothetical protein